MSPSSNWNVSIRTPGAPRRQRLQEPRQEDRLADVAHVQPEGPVGRRRVVTDAFLDRDVEHVERMPDGLGEPVRLGCRRHAALRADEQRIAVEPAQPRQRVAHRRLRHAEPDGGTRDAALGVDGLERLQQVEIDAGDIHGMNDDYQKYAMDR